MIKDKHFKITYYSNKDGKHITRVGMHDDKSRFWTSKVGEALYTYFDLDQWGYRSACIIDKIDEENVKGQKQKKRDQKWPDLGL